jgi:hypothetical protein
MNVLARDETPRKGVLFGYFGGAVNVADGRYTYHRYPADLLKQDIYQYTVMPTHIFEPFSVEELAGATLSEPLAFTRGVPLLKVPVGDRSPFFTLYGPGGLLEDETRLYDLQTDPGQDRPLADPGLEARMLALMKEMMHANDGPPEAFVRLGLDPKP